MKSGLTLFKSSGSSSRWLARQASDPYVKLTAGTGYRSRAAHKLLSLTQKYPQLIPRHGTVVDLGCAPGGWAQVASEKVGPRGSVVGVDLLPVNTLGDKYANVRFLKGDFLSPPVQSSVVKLLEAKTHSAGSQSLAASLTFTPRVDTVLSDMMANMSGIRIRDVSNSKLLCESALSFAVRFLRYPLTEADQQADGRTDEDKGTCDEQGQGRDKKAGNARVKNKSSTLTGGNLVYVQWISTPC